MAAATWPIKGLVGERTMYENTNGLPAAMTVAKPVVAKRGLL